MVSEDGETLWVSGGEYSEGDNERLNCRFSLRYDG